MVLTRCYGKSSGIQHELEGMGPASEVTSLVITTVVEPWICLQQNRLMQ